MPPKNLWSHDPPLKEQTPEERRRLVDQVCDPEWIGALTPFHRIAIRDLRRAADDLAAVVMANERRRSLIPRLCLDPETERAARLNCFAGSIGMMLERLLGEIDRLRELLLDVIQEDAELEADGDPPPELLELASAPGAPDLSEIQDILDQATTGPFRIVAGSRRGIGLETADGKHVARFVDGISFGDLHLFGRAREWLQALVTEARAWRFARQASGTTEKERTNR
jgi:hypothetical protein